LAFAEAGSRVVIIDADLRRPSVHRALAIPNEGGLADMLEKGQAWPEGFRRVTTGLECLPSGARPANPASLLSSRYMPTLLEYACERADVVLIDSPPLLAVADSLPIAAHVDGVVLVARFGVTERRSLVRAKALLEKVGANPIGVILNGLSARETRRHYAEYNRYVSGHKSSA